MIRSLLSTLFALWMCCSVTAQSGDGGDPAVEYDADRLYSERVDPSLFDVDPRIESNLFGRNFDRRFGFIANTRRGYDLSSNQLYLDNIRINDAATGRAVWSLLGLLRSSAVVDYADTSPLSMCRSASPFAYGESYVLNPSVAEHCSRIKARYGSTMLGAGLGYSVAGSLSRRWVGSIMADVRGGTDVNIRSLNGVRADFGASVQRISESKGRLVFSVMGRFDSRDQRLPITANAAAIKGDNLYNPAWGWWDGERRNSRMRNQADLLAVAKYASRIGRNTDFTAVASVSVRHSERGALAWFDAMDPRPDYYRYMPGFVGNEYVDEVAKQAWVNNSQVEWRELYAANMSGNGMAKYVMERRTESVADVQFAASFVSRLDDRATLGYGARGRVQRGDHFKTLADKLGAQRVDDIDSYLIDNEVYGDKLHNNMRDKDRPVEVGDRFGYNYLLMVDNVEVFADMSYRLSPVVLRLGVISGNVGYRRDGRFEKELFGGDESFGKSSRAGFNTLSVSGEVLYKPRQNHTLSLRAAYSSDAPTSTALFVSPRYRNAMVDARNNVTTTGAELNYHYLGKGVSISVVGYYATMGSMSDVYGYYDDLEGEYCNMYMYDISRRHYGAEVTAQFALSPSFSMDCAVAVGSHTYNNNPKADITQDNNGRKVVTEQRVDMSGYTVGNVAGKLFSAGLRYNRNLWIASLTASVADNRYVEPTPLRRMERSYKLLVGNDMLREFVAQEQLPTAVSVDLFVQRSVKIGRRSNYMTVYFSANNIFGRRDNVFTAYEPMRVRRSKSGATYSYSPMPNTYLYSNERSFHIGVSFKLK